MAGLAVALVASVPASSQSLGVPPTARAAEGDERALQNAVELLEGGRLASGAEDLRRLLLTSRGGLVPVDGGRLGALRRLAYGAIERAGPEIAPLLARPLAPGEMEEFAELLSRKDLFQLDQIGLQSLIHPLGIAARESRCELLMSAGRLGEAAADWQHMADILPSWHERRPTALAGLARALAAAGRRDELRSLLEEIEHSRTDDVVTLADETRPLDRYVRGLLIKTEERAVGRPSARPSPSVSPASLKGVGALLGKRRSPLLLTPVLFDGPYLYFLTSRGLQVVEPATGKLARSSLRLHGIDEVPPGELELSACGRPDRVALRVGGMGGGLRLLDPQEGREVGRFPTTSSEQVACVGPSPVCKGGTLVFAANVSDDAVVTTRLFFIGVEAAEPRGGATLWVAEREARSELPAPAMAAAGNRVFVASGTGAVAAVDLHERALLWLTEYPTVRRRRGAPDPPVVVRDRLVVHPPDSAAPLLFEVSDGRRVEVDAGREAGEVRLLPAGRERVVLLGKNTVRALDPEAGRLVWENVRWPRDVHQELVTATNEQLLVPVDGEIRRLDLSRGTWREPLQLARPGRVYCTSQYVVVASEQDLTIHQNTSNR